MFRTELGSNPGGGPRCLVGENLYIIKNSYIMNKIIWWVNKSEEWTVDNTCSSLSWVQAQGAPRFLVDENLYIIIFIFLYIKIKFIYYE